MLKTLGHVYRRRQVFSTHRVMSVGCVHINVNGDCIVSTMVIYRPKCGQQRSTVDGFVDTS